MDEKEYRIVITCRTDQAAGVENVLALLASAGMIVRSQKRDLVGVRAASDEVADVTHFFNPTSDAESVWDDPQVELLEVGRAAPAAEPKGSRGENGKSGRKPAKGLRIEFDESISEEEQKQYLDLFAKATKELTGKDVEFSVQRNRR